MIISLLPPCRRFSFLAAAVLALIRLPGAFLGTYAESPVADRPKAEPPRLLAQPVGAILVEGGRTTLAARVLGTEPFVYRWFRDGAPVPGALNAPTLELTGATLETSGAYTLEVDNAAGSVRSQPAAVRVRSVPRFTRHPFSRTVLAGASATFSAPATGSGPLRYQWRRDGVPLPGANANSLTLQNVRESDAGRYSVSVANELGSSSSDPVVLNVLAAVPGDTDGDGMPDDYERLHGLNPASAGDADLDPDGDGLNNLQEFLAGTDPKSAASALRVTGLAPIPAGDGWRLVWTSVVGRDYALQRWDGAELAPSGAPSWIDVGRVKSAGATTAFVDGSAHSVSLYRVRALDPGQTPTTPGPVLDELFATPAAVAAEGLVTLTVRATDSSGVSKVGFLDGSRPIADGTRLDAGTWRAFWPVDPTLNGLHRITATAVNRAGMSTTSAPISLQVSINQSLARLPVGTIVLRSESFGTGGNTVVPGSTLLVGGISLGGIRDFVVNGDQRLVTGNAHIAVPGLGVVHDGAFSLDSSSGWITALRGGALAAPGSTPFATIPLSGRCFLSPSELRIQVLTNSMQGSGLAELRIPGFASGPARLEGAWFFDPIPNSLTVRGKVSLGSPLGSNLVATVQLADSTLSVFGGLSLPAGSGGAAMALIDARLSLAFDAAGLPVFEIQGTRRDNGQNVAGSLAGDGSFRLATAPATPAFVREHPDLFVPLGPDGTPLEGLAVQARPDGSLPPFDYRPAGRSVLGTRGSFRLRFPGGARFIEGTPPQLEFIQVEAAFGPDGPLQFSNPLVRPGGATRRLAVGPLDLRTLAGLFDQPGDLPVSVFGHVPLRWKGGTITDSGIQDAYLVPDAAGLPLPQPAAGLAQSLPGFHLDFETGGDFVLRLPLFGELTLNDAAGSPLRIGIPVARPAWLAIWPNGHLSLAGRGRAELPNGARFEVEMLLDDPVYRLGLVAAGLHFNLLDGLADFLPTAACTLPAAGPTPTESALSAALLCRRKLERAYASFSAALDDSRSPDASAPASLSPSSAGTIAGNALEAWAAVALSSSGALPHLERLADLLRESRNNAVASRDLNGVLRQRVAFERALKAIRDRQSGGDGAGPGPDQGELNRLADDIAAAAVLRAADPAALDRRESFRATLSLLLEAESLSQRLGQDPPGRTPVQRPDLLAAMRNLVAAYSARLCDESAIARNSFRAAPGSLISSLPRASAYQALADLLDILATAMQLGLDPQLDARLSGEFVRQLVDRVERLDAAALDLAESNRDFLGFANAAAEYLYLDSNIALFASDTDLVTRLSNTKSSLAARLGSVAENDPTFNLPPSLPALATRVRRLSEFLGRVPASVTQLTPPARATLERIAESLAAALPRLGESSALPDALPRLLDLLDAGTRATELRERFALPPDADWNNAGLAAVVGRIVDLAISQRAWKELHDATTLLFERSTNLVASAPARARLYLEQTDRLLGAAHQVAVAVWNVEKQNRAILQLADMLLPGEIIVEKASGSLEFNRRTRELSGAFGGDLALPQFAGRLSILHASFSTGGEFDIGAAGNLSFPSADNPRLQLGILPRHPLHVYGRRDGGFGLSGSGRVAANGMFFEGFVTLEDPIFGFGIATGGQRIDLPEKLFGTIPVLNTQRLSALPAHVRLLGADYLAALGNSLEPLSRLTPPEFAPVGSPPDYAESEFEISTAPISAAAGGIVLVLAAPVALGIEAATPAITNLVAQLDQEWNRFQRDVRRAEQDLREATANGKSRAARALAKTLGDFARALNQAARASSAILAAQQQGRVPSGPQFLPDAGRDPATTCGQIRNQLELLAADPDLARDEKDVLAILGAMEQYRALATDAGCPGLSVPPQQANDFVSRARATVLGKYGLGEDGTIVNRAVFEGLSDPKLEEASHAAFGITAGSQLVGADPASSLKNRQIQTTLYVRRHQLRAADVKRARDAKYPSGGSPDVDGLRQEAVRDASIKVLQLFGEMQFAAIDDATLPGAHDGSTNAVSAVDDYAALLGSLGTSLGKLARYQDTSHRDYDVEYKKILDRRRLEEILSRGRTPEIDDALRQALRAPLLQRPWRVPPAALATLRQETSAYARQLHRRALDWAANSSTVQFTLRESVQLARHLMALSRALEESGRSAGARPGLASLHSADTAATAAGLNDDLVREIGARILPVFTARVTALARARQAWWVLTETSRILAEGSAANAAANLSLSATAGADAALVTLSAADTLIHELFALVRNEPVNLLLPGDLSIDRAFGEIELNRASGLVRGSFGGKLRFPNSEFYVEVDHATVDSNGRFTFGGELAAPLPIGGLRAKAHVDVAGEVRVVNRRLEGALTHFSGTGSLFLPPLDGTQEIEIAASLSYSDDHTLTLTTVSRDLDLAFGRHFKLFDAGGSLAFRDPARSVLPIPLPGTGELELTGAVGLFARTDAPTVPADYYLSGENIRVRFTSRLNASNGRLELAVALLEGQLILPEFFTTGQCADAAAAANPGARPRVQIDPAHPLGVVFTLKAPAAGQPPSLESVRFDQASLQLRNVGVSAPDLPNLGAEICEGTLRLPALTLGSGPAPLPALPSIHITRGTMSVPFPPGQTNRLALADFQWNLDGFPTGSVELATDLTLLDLGGFRFQALARDPATGAATRLTVGQATGRQPPPLELSGRVRFVVSPDVLQREPTPGDSSTEVALVLAGTVALEPGKAPDLSRLFDGVALEGSFKLGNGIAFRGFPARNGLPVAPARVALSNLRGIPSIFAGQSLPDAQAFTVTLSGLIQIPDGPGFGGRNLRFIFHNRPEGRPPNAPNGIPEFRPGSFDYDATGWELAQSLPFRVSAATLAQVDPNAALPWPLILRPENWQLTISAGLSLPSPERPIVTGEVYDWSVRFQSDGLPRMNLEAITLGIGNLSFPPIDNIGGTVHLGGLENPRNLFFVGRVGGFIYGYGVDLLLGFNKSGPIGACVRGTLGNVGIPLGTSGFILNGAAGGVSFANTSGDPCEISNYINADGSLKKNDDWPSADFPISPMTWTQVADFLDRYRDRERVFGKAASPLALSSLSSPPSAPLPLPATLASYSSDPARVLASQAPGRIAWLSPVQDDSPDPDPDTSLRPATFPLSFKAPRAAAAAGGPQAPRMSKWETPCPDDCPPPTVNIFCEPHPDRELYPNRVIAKFSSLDEAELAAIGLTKEHVKELWQRAGRNTDALADLVAAQLRSAADALAPRAFDGLPKAAEINAFIDHGLDSVRDAFAILLRDRLRPLAQDQLTDDNLWRQVAEIAYRGAPCPDLTVKLAGQLGHFTGAISGDAGVVLSTAGTAGIVADVNLLGVPVGRLDGYLAVTDKFGNFNPSLCGQLEVEIGPVDIGKIAASLVGTMSPDAARAFFGALGTCMDARVLGPLARQIKADLVTVGKSSSDLLAQLDLTQQLALAGLLQKQPGLDGMVPCLRTALAQGWNQYNPELRACGEGQPRVMGIPTGPRLADLAAQGKKTSLFAAVDASASGTIAYAATLASCTIAGAAIGAVVTVWIFGYGAIAGGVAGAGVGLTVGAIAGGVTSTLFSFERGMVALEFETPDPMEGIVAAMSGKLSSPEKVLKYGSDGIDLMLQKATLGSRFSLVPLGFKTASASTRIVLPEWNDHPNRPGVGWIEPGTGSRADWPSPSSLLLEITRRRVLPDPTWKGSSTDLAALFAQASRSNALVSGRADLKRDYFPYGGYLYGFDLLLPRALVSAVPQEFKTAADPNANPLERFVGAMNYVEKYVMTTTNVGALASYVPFPGPLVFEGNGRRFLPHELLSQVTDFDTARWVNTLDSQGVAAAAKVFPAHLFFAEGYLDGTLLGVPIANASLKLIPPDIRPPTRPPLFEVIATVPAGSWLSDWVDRASLRFELSQAPPLSIEEWSTNVVAPLIAEARHLTNAALVSAAANQDRLRFADHIVSALASNLPKAYLDASLENLHIPPRLANLIQIDPRATARLRAFSPRFAPGEIGDSPLADARRNGGVVLQGSFMFGNLVSVTNAEIAFLPNALSLLDPRSPPTIHARIENATLGGAGAGLNFANATVELLADLSYPLAPGSREPRLTFEGRLASIALPPDATAPLMEIRPLDGQSDLGVTLDFNLAGRKTFHLSPGQLLVRGAFAGDARLRIHGATPSDPFVYSATEPWTNRLSLATAGNLPALALGGQPLVQVASSNLSGLVLVRDLAGVITLKAKVRGGSRLDFFPGTTLATSRAIDAEGSLEIGTDGSFSLLGSSSTDWALGGTTLPAGAFALRAEAITRTASLALSTAGSLGVGLFSLEPLVAGTPLDVRLALHYLPAVGTQPGRWDLGLSLPPARLRLPAPGNSPAPSISSTTTFRIDGGLDARGNPLRFSLSGDATTETTARLVAENALNLWARNVRLGAGVPASTELVRYDGTVVGSVSFRGQRSGLARISLPSSGTVTIAPAFDLSRRQFRLGPGDLEIDAAGTFHLWGNLASEVSSGDSFAFNLRFGVGTSFDLTQARSSYGLSATTLDGVALPGLALSGRADFVFDLPFVSAGLEATLAFDPIRLPWLEWLPASATATRLGGSLRHTLGALAASTSLNVDASQLRLGGANGTTIPLQTISIRAGGSFEQSLASVANLVMPVPGSSSGFPLRNLALVFRRTPAGDLLVDVNGARLALPGWPEYPVSGLFTGNGPRLRNLSSSTGTPIFGFAADLGLGLAIGSDAYADLVRSHAPEAYWRLDDNYAPAPLQTTVFRVRDEMNRHSTVVTNSAKVSPLDVVQNESGAIPGNRAFSFAAGSSVLANANPALELTGPLSLEAWVRVRQWNRDWQTVVGKGDTTWQIHRYQNSRKIAFGTYSDATAWHDLVGTIDLDDGRWHHVVATYDGSTKRLYLDGRLDAASTAVTGLLANRPFRVGIGGNAEIPNRAFDGWIDEVALYRRALADDEILEHAAAGFSQVAGHLAVTLPGFGSQTSVRLQGTLGTDGAAAFLASGQTQRLAPGLELANASVRFTRPAGAAQANLALSGELDSPSLRQLLEVAQPLLFSASSTGPALDLSFALPAINLGPGDDLQLSDASLRLSASGLRLSGAKLRASPVLAGQRRNYLSLALPEFALPVSVPAAGLATNLVVGPFNLLAPGTAGGTSLVPHAFKDAAFTLTWKPNVLALENFATSLPALPGFPEWPAANFRAGRLGTDGRLNVSTTILPDLDLGIFKLQGVTAVLSETGLRLAGTDLQVGSFFRLDNRLLDLALPADANGTFDWVVSAPPALTLAGLPFSRVPLTFRRAFAPATPALASVMSPIRTPVLTPSAVISDAELAVPGIPAFRFGGTIPANGNFVLSHKEPNPISFLGFSVTMTNTLVRPAGTASDLVLADAPEAYWRLGDNYSRLPFSAGEVYRVIDATGRHSATITNLAKPAAPNVSQNEPGIATDSTAFLFGGGNFVVLEPDVGFELRSSLTLEAWVKVRTWNREWQTILGKGDTTWQLHRYGNSRKVSFGTYQSGNWHDLAGTPDLDDGRWHHLVATYDGTTKRLFIDGLLDASTTAISGPLPAGKIGVGIGGSSEAAGRTFDGWIDEVAIYPKALSPDQIEKHYRAIAGGALSSTLGLVFNGQPFAGFRGSLAADGSVRTRAELVEKTMGGFSFGSASLDFQRIGASGNANIQAIATLGRPLAWPANLLSPAPAFAGSIQLNGTTPWITVTSLARPTAVLGFPVDSLDFTLNGPLFPPASPAAAITLQNAKLNGYPLLPANLLLSGSLPNTGLPTLSRTLALGVGGFQASAGTVTLDRNGLTVSGDFGLKATVLGREYNFERDARTVNFKGSYTTARQLVDGALLGSFPLKLGGFAADSAGYRLGASGLFLGLGEHLMNFGALKVPFSIFSLDATGLTSFAGSKASTWSCSGCLFSPSASFTVSLSRNAADGTLGASLSGTGTARGPTAPDGSNPATYNVTLSGGIGSDGTASANLPGTFYLFENVKNGCCFDPPFCTKRFDCNQWVGHNTVSFDLW